MSNMKRYFEEHIDDYSDEELIEQGLVDSKKEAEFLRECLSGKKQKET